MGIGGRMFQWIRDYITSWSFFGQTDVVKTTEHYTYCSVPQGAALSATLSNVVLIGLAEVLPKLVCLSIYADDSCLWSAEVTRPQMRARIQREPHWEQPTSKNKARLYQLRSAR